MRKVVTIESKKEKESNWKVARTNMKKFTFKGVLDGFRSTVQTAQERGHREIEETLRPNDFTLKKVRTTHTLLF